MPKIKGGYILQPRIFDDSKASKMSPVTRELWFYLLRKVNHKPYNGLLEGQKFFRFSDIQEDLSWHVGYRKMVYSKPQLTKALRRLCEGNMTATAKATHGIVITICNYSQYQDPKNYEGNDEGSTKEPRRKSRGNNIYKNGKELQEEQEEDIYTTNFLKFWGEYPKKQGKGAAFKSYQKIKDPKPTLTGILKSVAEHKKIKQWQDKDFIPYPATWLNQRRWEDEIEIISDRPDYWKAM